MKKIAIVLFLSFVFGNPPFAVAESKGTAQYTIGAGGTLAAMHTEAVAASANAHAVTVDPSGQYAYVANEGSDNISQYTIGTDGSLTAMPIASVAAGRNPHSVTIDPSGQYAYVANTGRMKLNMTART